MPKLVKHDSIDEDKVRLLDNDTQIDSLSQLDQNCALTLQTFLNLKESISESSDNRYAIWLAAGDEVNELEDDLSHIDLIVLHVENFMDGRFFSQARILRDHFDFKGDIRAHGAFLQDQVFYLSRCGVSSFSVDDDADIESLQKSLNDFTETYQAGCDEPQPLFRRRA